jgi:Zn finger protein HypA/HybF involved in hydrogenase expression
MPYHRKTTTQFVEEAQRVHGEKFDYSEVEYANTHTPVKIKCRQCGVVFMQEPASHLAGCGCPKCSKKKTDRKTS